MKQILSSRLTVWLLSLFFLMPGVSRAGSLSEQQMKKRPRIRIASSPYPNVLFRVLERPQFGEHHYNSTLARSRREVSRGHFYTRRGGFIDLAHLRKTTDWAAYLQATMEKDLKAGHTEIRYSCAEPSRYVLQVRYPEAVEAMGPLERDRFIHALSLDLALYASYTALTWHEILTWYGFSAVPGVSEQQSAFSYEDMFTHAVGIAVARTALRDETRDYNAAVSAALEAEIKRLEPMVGADTRRALEAVKGRWWLNGKSLKRYTDIGMNGPLLPWLVDDIPCDDPVSYAAPGLQNVMGFDMRERIDLHIDPNVRASRKILKVLAREKGNSNIQPATDFPRIMQDVRQAMVERYGPGALKP